VTAIIEDLDVMVRLLLLTQNQLARRYWFDGEYIGKSRDYSALVADAKPEMMHRAFGGSLLQEPPVLVRRPPGCLAAAAFAGK
jgi:hypothetical protein